MAPVSNVIELKRINSNQPKIDSASEDIMAPTDGNGLRQQAQIDLRQTREDAAKKDQQTQSGAPLLQAIGSVNTGLLALMAALNAWDKRLTAEQAKPAPQPAPTPQTDPQLELMLQLSELVKALAVMVQRISGAPDGKPAAAPTQDQEGDLSAGDDATGGASGKPVELDQGSGGKDKTNAQSSTNPFIGWLGLISGLLSEADRIGLLSSGKPASSGELK